MHGVLTGATRQQLLKEGYPEVTVDYYPARRSEDRRPHRNCRGRPRRLGKAKESNVLTPVTKV